MRERNGRSERETGKDDGKEEGEREREGEVMSYHRVSMSWLEELKINKNWSGGYKNWKKKSKSEKPNKKTFSSRHVE